MVQPHGHRGSSLPSLRSPVRSSVTLSLSFRPRLSFSRSPLASVLAPTTDAACTRSASRERAAGLRHRPRRCVVVTEVFRTLSARPRVRTVVTFAATAGKLIDFTRPHPAFVSAAADKDHNKQRSPTWRLSKSSCHAPSADAAAGGQSGNWETVRGSFVSPRGAPPPARAALSARRWQCTRYWIHRSASEPGPASERDTWFLGSRQEERAADYQ